MLPYSHRHVKMESIRKLNNFNFQWTIFDGFRLKLLTGSIKGRPEERDKSNPLRRDSA